MKRVIFIFALLISGLSFSQTAKVTGIIKDAESNNEPLIFAEVSIKETGAKTTSDANGFFSMDNIEAGNYTLVVSFVGYKTLEKAIIVTSGKHLVETISMGASSLGIDEIMSVLAKADNGESSTESSIIEN